MAVLIKSFISKSVEELKIQLKSEVNTLYVLSTLIIILPLPFAIAFFLTESDIETNNLILYYLIYFCGRNSLFFGVVISFLYLHNSESLKVA